MASVGMAAGSAASLLAALGALGPVWEGHTRRIGRWLPKSVWMRRFPLSNSAIRWQPQRQPMAAVGCQGLNYSLSMSLGITEPSR